MGAAARSRERAWGRSALGQPAAARPGALTPTSERASERARAPARGPGMHVLLLLLLGPGGRQGERLHRRARTAAPGGCTATTMHCPTPLPTHTPYLVPFSFF